MKKMKLNIQLFANGCVVTIKSITQDIINNCSIITIHGKLTTGSSTYNYGGAYMQPTISNQPIIGNQTSSQTLTKKKYNISTNDSKEDDWTFTVYHNDDGTCNTLTISIRWYVTSNTNGTVSLSGGYTPTIIPRASSVAAPNGALGQTMAISITRNDNSFTHTLRYECGSDSGWIADIDHKVDELKIWAPSLSLANQNKEGNTVKCIIYCQTYNGNQTVGSETSVTVTLTIPYSPPINVSITSIADSNSYKNTYGTFIQNKSNITAILYGEAQYSDIASYEWQIRQTDSSGNILASGNTSNINYIPTTSGTLYISGTITDKRGKYTSVNTSVTVAAYNTPTCQLVVSRINSTSAEYTVTGSGSSINNIGYTTNTVTYILKRDSTTIHSWNGSSLNQNGTDTILDQSYTYTLTAQDTISGITDTKVVDISTTFTLMNFNSTGYAMAIGKASEAVGNNKLLEVALPTTHTENVDLERSNGETKYLVKRTDTGSIIELLIDTTGYVRGIYDRTQNKWLLYNDGNEVVFKGKADSSINVTEKKSLSAISHSNYGTNNGYLPDISFISLWNGAYNSSNDSNLAYCTNGIILGDTNFPIDSVIITATNNAPNLPGTWTLIDKEFSSSTGNTGYTRNTTNCTTVGTFDWTRSGHTITLTVNFTNKVAITDTSLTMFTLNFSTLGITQLHSNYYGQLYTDAGGCSVFYQINSTSGAFNTVEVIPDSQVNAGRDDNRTTISFNVPKEYMLDSACDKFYWKRIA